MSHRHYKLNNINLDKLNFNFLSIALSRDDNDWKNILHTHYFTELFFVISGKGKFLFQDETYTITEGDLIIVPPYVDHTEQSDENSPLEYYVIGMEGIIFRHQNHPASFHSLCRFSDSSIILELFRQIMYEVQTRNFGSELICHNLLEILLLRIIRTQNLIPEPTDNPPILKECAKIKEYLDTHYADLITLETLTDITHMSKYYMAHTFTRYIGQSPMQYLTERRLEIACSLLENTDLSIASIASECGFSSQSYFTQIFRKKKSETPLEYRSRHRS